MQKNQRAKKDRKSADFIGDNSNGMEFFDGYWLKDKERWQAMLPASPDSPVQCLLEMAKFFGLEGVLFAYKGGNHERQWLEQAHLPAIHLEVFGCLRFDALVNLADNNDRYRRRATASCAVPHYRLTADKVKQSAVPCDMHVHWQGRYPPHRPIHCPASECRVFHLWKIARIAALS